MSIWDKSTKLKAAFEDLYHGTLKLTKSLKVAQRVSNEKDNALFIKALFGDLRIPVSLGKVDGVEIVNILGVIEDVDAETTRDILPFPVLFYPWLNAAQILEVSSSSVLDTFTIRIKGLDANHLEITEDLLLNGTTVVNTINSYLRINEVYNLDGVRNAGDIDLKYDGNIIGRIPLEFRTLFGLNRLMQGVYTVPAGKTAVITKFARSISKKGSSSGVKEGTVYLEARESQKPFYPLVTTTGRSDGASASDIDTNYPLVVLEKSDIVCRCTALDNNSAFSCAIQIVIIDNTLIEAV